MLCGGAGASWRLPSRRSRRRRSRTVRVLPPGVTELHSEMVVDADLRGDPAGSTLRMAADFRGRAAIVVRGQGIRLRDFDIEGNRQTNEVRTGLPPYDVPFAQLHHGQRNSRGWRGKTSTIEHVHFREIAGFAVWSMPVAASLSTACACTTAARATPTGKQQHDRRHPVRSRHDRLSRHELRVPEHPRQRPLDALALHRAAQRARRVRGQHCSTRSAATRYRQVTRSISASSATGHAASVFREEIVDAAPVAIDTAGNVERTPTRATLSATSTANALTSTAFTTVRSAWNDCMASTGTASS